MKVNPKSYRRTLILQGGGFRTAFTAGVLDAFLEAEYFPFDAIVANSGGAIAASYYVSGQKNAFITAMKHLAEDPHFVQYSRVLKQIGLMDVDYFQKIADEIVPFHLEKALLKKEILNIRFVATHSVTGKAHYLQPERHNWMDVVIASCTLPFLTKGKHPVADNIYFDGGWSDALPIQWAYTQGTKDALIIRTLPIEKKLTQSWTDWVASYINQNKSLRKTFANNHNYYNNSIDFIKKPPLDLRIEQIAPETPLKSSTYTKNKLHLELDYAYGYELGEKYLLSQIEEKSIDQ